MTRLSWERCCRVVKTPGFIAVMLLCTGCSWEIFPFIRNLSGNSVRVKVLSLKENNDFNGLLFLTDSIYSIDHKTRIDFTDTVKISKVDSKTWFVDIPPHSTALVQLPYGWRLDDYTILVERPVGKVDTLNRSVNFTVIRRDGKAAQYPRAFSHDRIYYDIE